MFANAVEEAFLLGHDLEVILCKDVPLKALTDRFSLFRIIIRCTIITERRLMMDPQAGTEKFDRQHVVYVNCIDRNVNTADSLTKIMLSNVMLKFL